MAPAAADVPPPARWGRGGPAVRLGIGSAQGIGDDLAEAIAAGRPYASMEDLHRRVSTLTLPQLESLASAGAFGCFGLDRREALRQAGAVAQGGRAHLPGIVTGAAPPTLGAQRPGASPSRTWSARASRPTATRPGSSGPSSGSRGHHRSPAAGSARRSSDQGGRGRHPSAASATAQGITFLNLEDETGFAEYRRSPESAGPPGGAARGAAALIVHGKVESAEGVVNVLAQKIEALRLPAATRSRDFR